MNSVLRGEMVKKFESVIKQEMSDHEKVISSYHKEIQSLRDTVRYTLDQCKSLFRHTEKELQEKTEDLQKLIEVMSNKIKSNDLLIADQRNSIVSLFQSLNEFSYLSAKKSEFEQFKIQIYQYINEKLSENDRKSENHNKFIENSLNFLNEELREIKKEMHQNLNDLDERINQKFSISKMDKDGVLKEIRVYEKNTFVIEKKIENLYTLIERINQRGASCHKQE